MRSSSDSERIGGTGSVGLGSGTMSVLIGSNYTRSRQRVPGHSGPLGLAQRLELLDQLGARGIELQCLRVIGLGLALPVQCEIHVAQVLEHLRLVRPQPDGPLELAPGLLEPPQPEVRPAQ